MQPPKVQHLQGLKPNIFRGEFFGKFRRRKKNTKKKKQSPTPLDSPLKRSILHKNMLVVSQGFSSSDGSKEEHSENKKKHVTAIPGIEGYYHFWS